MEAQLATKDPAMRDREFDAVLRLFYGSADAADRDPRLDDDHWRCHIVHNVNVDDHRYCAGFLERYRAALGLAPTGFTEEELQARLRGPVAN